MLKTYFLFIGFHNPDIKQSIETDISLQEILHIALAINTLIGPVIIKEWYHYLAYLNVPLRSPLLKRGVLYHEN